MNPKTVDLLQAYFDGELQPEEKRRAETLLAESQECRELIGGWQRQRLALGHLKKTAPDDNAFVNRVMTGIAALNAPKEKREEAPDFLRWLFPALGYAFSAALVFFTFSARPPAVNADTILLSAMPKETHSVFMARKTDASQMFATEEMK